LQSLADILQTFANITYIWIAHDIFIICIYIIYYTYSIYFIILSKVLYGYLYIHSYIYILCLYIINYIMIIYICIYIVYLYMILHTYITVNIVCIKTYGCWMQCFARNALGSSAWNHWHSVSMRPPFHDTQRIHSIPQPPQRCRNMVHVQCKIM
jgi:hypothetical protein